MKGCGALVVSLRQLRPVYVLTNNQRILNMNYLVLSCFFQATKTFIADFPSSPESEHGYTSALQTDSMQTLVKSILSSLFFLILKKWYPIKFSIGTTANIML